MYSSIRLSAILFGFALIASPAQADKIKHPIAVFNGLDKITGRIISFEVAIDETVQFGTLQLTPRVCFSRPATEAPQTDGFVEVDDLQPDKKLKRLFSGWMFADSPGLHGVEHPVYDVWLIDCKGDGPLIHEAPQFADAPDDQSDSDPNATPGAAPPNGGAIELAKPPKKPKKPKPTAPPPVAGDSAPLDLGAFNPPPPPASAPHPARPPRRIVPVDVAPIPPADIPQ